MSDAYVYSGARAKTLENALLSHTQTELLTSAKGVDELRKALYDTYLAPYLSRQGNESISGALDESIIETKKFLTKVSPNPEALDVLWIKYDFYNLKAIIKGKRAGMSDNSILENCFKVAMVEPGQLLAHVVDGTLSYVHPYFEEARKECEAIDRILEIDNIILKYYFLAIQEIAAKIKDPFVTKFVRLLVDLFNIKAALRAFAIEGIEPSDVYVSGGSFTADQLASKESVLGLLQRFGGEKRWTEAITHFETSGKYSWLEKVADEYVREFLKEESRLVFTLASLFSYFHASKNNAQIIGAIMVAKKTGMDEKDLRSILRRVYA